MAHSTSSARLGIEVLNKCSIIGGIDILIVWNLGIGLPLLKLEIHQTMIFCISSHFDWKASSTVKARSKGLY